ncbi:hypothetical protein HY312_01995 [Candidatus Saccharibacteria bacterium]|nr:hypothetical protein [Candidatus Saccharibacteria bacterium]
MRRSRARAAYLSFVFTISLIMAWQATQMLSLFTTGELALCLLRISIAIANFMTPFFLLFAMLFPYEDAFPKKRIFVQLFIPALLLLPMTFHPAMISSVSHVGLSQTLVTGLFYDVQAAYTIIMVLLAAIVLLRKALRAKGDEKKAIVFILAAFIVPLVTGTLANFGGGSIENGAILFVPISFLITAGLIAYAMVRHQLFDIRLTIVRTITYGGVLLTLSGTYYLLAYILSISIFGTEATTSFSISPVNIVLALVLAFLFQPVKRFFDRWTNRIFFRDTYTSDDFFAKFSRLLASVSDLRGLLGRASAELVSTMKAKQGFFYVHVSSSHHISEGTLHHSRLMAGDVALLDKYVKQKGNGIIVAEIVRDDQSIYRMMSEYKIAIILPLRHIDSVIGYLCLGDHQGSGYTQRDIRVLETVTDELVVAIQNSLSIQAVKEINATLQQRIDVATKELRSSNSQLRHLDEVKDEFMSMASHQLRTPLTSIKGYLSMVLEEDMGKITPQQRTVLNEAFNSSERMVRLIADFLNVSRLQTGKFIVERNPVDVVSVVGSEVESLKMIANTHDMKLAYHSKEKELIIPVDEAKLRQVIMNFIDNSIYYSKPNTTINVSLERIDDDIAFKVVDTGIGVPKDEQEMLFNKFFRAKNARQQRPDGTGVGLYLAKKVVTAHGGKMIFSSVEGQGSTFGFRIPLPKLQAGSEANNLKD